MNLLDEEGNQLFEAMQLAKQNWIRYITPIVLKYISQKMADTRSPYFKYDYLYSVSMREQSKIISQDTEQLYKKLSLVFHPDKFKTNSDCIFKLINAAHREDNIILLQKIESDIDKLKKYTPEELKKYVDNIDKNDDNTKSTRFDNIPNSYYEAYHPFIMDSIAYKIFMEADDYIFDDYYFTPEKLINHIENNYMTDIELKYYESLSEYDETVRLGLEKRKAKHGKKKTL